METASTGPNTRQEWLYQALSLLPFLAFPPFILSHGNLLVVIPVFVAVSAVTMVVRSRHHATGDPTPLTGRVLPPARPTPTWYGPGPAPAARLSLTGGALLPGRSGYLHASAPFAHLDLEGRALTLRIDLGRAFGASPIVVTPDPRIHCYPVRTRTGLSTGIAVHPEGAPPAYFWNNRSGSTLAALAQAGFDVSWEERYGRGRNWR